MASEKNKEGSEQTFARLVLEKLNRILHRYMGGYDKYNELDEFMKDDKNLYNEDGSLTDEYKRRIAEIEGYVVRTSIHDAIEAEIINDETDKKVYQGIVDFIERRWSLIKEFDKTEELYEEDFDPEKFLNDFVSRNSTSEEERKNILEAMDKIAAEDAIEELDDEAVRNAFKDLVNYSGGKEDK